LGPVIGAADGEVFDVYLVILVIGGRSSCAVGGFGEKMDRGSLGRTRQERWIGISGEKNINLDRYT
jgi:hypothetical protein